MKNVFALAAAIVLLSLGGIAQANVFDLGPGLTNLEMVTVGDPGNAGEPSGDLIGDPYQASLRTCGAVDYNYGIGKYEVTVGQYTAFLNAVAATDAYGLYNTNMWTANSGYKIQQSGTSGSYSYTVGPNYTNRPVNWVSYWDACRFANWIGNGQGSGDTETGAYTLNGYNGQDGRTIGRNTGWTWAVTNEDEWYKAAYYKGGGTNAGYWLYPTQSDAIYTNMANYSNNVGHTTDLGSYPYPGAYGTFDQGGNLWEWNEAIVYEREDYVYRGRRGSAVGSDGSYLRASYRSRYNSDPTVEVGSLGFRVVSSVPEPSSIISLVGGLLGLLGIRWRRVG